MATSMLCSTTQDYRQGIVKAIFAGTFCRTRAFAVFLLAILPAAAQQQPAGAFDVPQRGTVPYGSYSVSQTESIDGVTGNLSLHIPLTQLPPGRAGMTDLVDL